MCLRGCLKNILTKPKERFEIDQSSEPEQTEESCVYVMM